MKKKMIAIIISALMLIPTAVFAEGNSDDSQTETKTQVTQQETATKSQDQDNKETSESKDNQQDSNKVTTDSKENKQGATAESKENNSEVQENNEGDQQYENEVNSENDNVQADTNQSSDLQDQISTEKEKLNVILNDIQDGKKTLTQEQLDLIVSKAETINKSVDKVNSFKGLNTAIDAVQASADNHKYKTAASSLKDVTSKLKARNAALAELNNNLKDILNIANQAQSL